jgi:hypothetical protein
MRPIVLATVDLVSRKTGATLQAICTSVLPFHVLVVRSHGPDSPATFTFGSHDFAMASWAFGYVAGSQI